MKELEEIKEKIESTKRSMESMTKGEHDPVDLAFLIGDLLELEKDKEELERLVKSKIRVLGVSAKVWGMTNTYEGHAFCDPQGQHVPVKIKEHGHGKYSSGYAKVTNKEYPSGIYKVTTNSGDIAIDFYPPEGGVEKLQDYRMAPKKVVKFAENFDSESDCYHCKCLEEHLQNAEVTL